MRKKLTNNLLLISYSVLGLLAIVAFFLYFTVDVSWARDIVLNLGTEITGIVLAVVLIDTVIRINQKRQRKKFESIALEQLRIPLNKHLTVLLNIYKASMPHKPTNPPTNFNDLFSDDYFTQIAFLDFSKQAPVAFPVDWFTYLSQEAQNFKDSLSRTVEKYSIYLSPDLVELIEEIINSSFLNFLLQAPAISKWDKQERFDRQYALLRGSGMTKIAKDYIGLFIRLAEYHNSTTDRTKQVKVSEELWGDNVSPNVGDSRIG